MTEADLAYSSAYEFINAQQWIQAIPRLVSTLEMCPEHINSLRALGRAYRETEQFEAARDTYNQLIEIRGNQAEAADYAGLGIVFTRLKDYDNARAAYMKAVVVSPDDCGILFNLGILHMAVADYRKAVEALEQTLEKCESLRDTVMPKLADACDKQAAKEEGIGNVERAEFYRDKGRQYAGQAGGSTTYDLIKQMMGEQKYREAVPLLQGMLAEDPQKPAALLSLARCQDALGQKGEAISAFERYLQVRPDDEKTTADLIRTYAEAGKCQQAITYARSAKTKFEPKGKTYLAGIYYAWGLALECSKQYSEAKAMFQQSLNCNHDRWNDSARQQIQRQQDLIDFEEAKKRQAEQGR
ncbi:MAG: tetratricopeptide repeat protein [bacterium]